MAISLVQQKGDKVVKPSIWGKVTGGPAKYCYF